MATKLEISEMVSPFFMTGFVLGIIAMILVVSLLMGAFTLYVLATVFGIGTFTWFNSLLVGLVIALVLGSLKGSTGD